MLSVIHRVSPLLHRSGLSCIRAFSATENEFRIRSHIENINDQSVPYVLIESSFLSRCLWKPSACIRAMHFIEKTIRKQGAVPVSLGMVDGDIILGMTHEELKSLCTLNTKKRSCFQETMSSLTSDNATAFISPSTALYLSKLYHIPTVFLGEISCIENGSDIPSEEGEAISASQSILISLGFHPNQQIQKSLDYWNSKNLSIMTLNSQFLPSSIGCTSSVKSPLNLDREDQLFNRVKSIHTHSQSALIFGKPYCDIPEIELNERIAKIVKKAEEKGIPKIYQPQFLQSTLRSSLNKTSRQAFFDRLESNASLAARIATLISTPKKGPKKIMESSVVSSLPPTYSVLCVGSKTIHQAEARAVVMIPDISVDSDTQQVNKVVGETMNSILSSKHQRSETNQDAFGAVGKPADLMHLPLKTPIIPFPNLPSPRQGCPIFITSSMLVHVAMDHVTHIECLCPTLHHSSLLCRIFTSILKESPPLHITIRGNDETAKKLAEIDLDYGDTNFGTTIVEGGITPEASVVINTKGKVESFGRTDLLMHQTSNEFVKKYADFLRKSPLIVCEGNLNVSTMQLIAEISTEAGIPVFMDCVENEEFDSFLKSGLSNSCKWMILSRESARHLASPEFKSRWNAIIKDCAVTGDEALRLVLDLQKHLPMIPNIYVSFGEFGTCFLMSDQEHTEINWLKGDSAFNEYSEVAFESGFLWGLMNQYPLDLSMSLGRIMQDQVNSSKTIFGKSVHSSCFANQIMKYMTGISSFDLF